MRSIRIQGGISHQAELGSCPEDNEKPWNGDTTRLSIEEGGSIVTISCPVKYLAHSSFH